MSEKISDERLAEMVKGFFGSGSVAMPLPEVREMARELLTLRASQPSEETKVTVLRALGIVAGWGRPDTLAALAELERMGWK